MEIVLGKPGKDVSQGNAGIMMKKVNVMQMIVVIGKDTVKEILH